MRRRTIGLLFAFMLLLLTSCGTQETPPATDSSSFDIKEVTFSVASVRLSESEHTKLGFFTLNKAMETTERKGVTYAFELKISLEERAACIQATEAILRKIGLDKPVQIHIYTTATYDDTYIKENAVFTHLQDWNSPEYISSLLYGLFGEYCNYGMIYGYANYLCGELYDVALDTCGVDWIYKGDINSLDLNLLCFRPEFVAEEDIRNVKKLANTFVADYIAANGEAELHRLLEISGDVEKVSDFVGILADFYASRNIDYTPAEILYRLGGKDFDYIVRSRYAVMYIEKDWRDANMDLCPFTYEGFLHQNYCDTKQFFTINTVQMGQYQALFDLESYDNDLIIYFSNTATQASAYMPQIHAIGLKNTASFMHEYIHALTVEDSIQEAWAIEGFARYYCYRYDYYGNAMSNADYNSIPDTERYRYIYEYKNNIGRDIDVSQDIEELLHIATYVYGYDSPNDGDGYTPGASFIGYLISRFGEEKVIEIICVTHDFGEFSYSELVADWRTFLEENYVEYSKYE